MHTDVYICMHKIYIHIHTYTYICMDICKYTHISILIWPYMRKLEICCLKNCICIYVYHSTLFLIGTLRLKKDVRKMVPRAAASPRLQESREGLGLETFPGRRAAPASQGILCGREKEDVAFVASLARVPSSLLPCVSFIFSSFLVSISPISLPTRTRIRPGARERYFHHKERRRRKKKH